LLKHLRAFNYPRSGGVSRAAKGADCKSAGLAFVGSSPTSPTNSPDECRSSRPLIAAAFPQLRIQTKKLRYAIELFASLFGGKQVRKRRKRLLCALERLQDGLGELNDIAAYEERIAAIGIRRRRSSAKRAFASGLLTDRKDARIDAAMATATRAHGDPARVRRFWQ
jgi:CHAD domain